MVRLRQLSMSDMQSPARRSSSDTALDLIHPFSDAEKLATDLGNGRLVRAHTPLELRIRPARLLSEIKTFLAECWKEPTSVARA